MWREKYKPEQEIVSQRNYSSKHFDLGNGKRVAILTGLLHAWDGKKFIELPPIPKIEGKLLDKPKKLHKLLDIPHWASCEVQDEGRAILFKDKNGVLIWKHSDVAVYDADVDPYIRDEEDKITGVDKTKVVPSKFVVQGSEVLLEVPGGLKYPLKVDPAGEIGQGTAPDSFISLYNPNYNNSLSDYLMIYALPNWRNRIIIRFDLSVLPVGVNIESTRLYLYQYSHNIEVDRTYDIHRVDHNTPNYETDWEEGGGYYGGVTWNNYKTGTAWGTSGGNFNSTQTDSITVGIVDNVWVIWNVTPDCDALEQRSWIIKDSDESNSTGYQRRFHSRQYTTDTSLRPYLEITYVVATKTNKFVYDNYPPLTWVQTTKVDFEAGVLNNTSATAKPGSVLPLSTTGNTIASQVHDTEIEDSGWFKLEWKEQVTGDGDIKFEVRASDTSFLKDDVTPDWVNLGVQNSPITEGLPRGRYKQWRASLEV